MTFTPPSERTAWIIGAGLCAATLNYELSKGGWQVEVFERDRRWGGLSRDAVMRGVIYEPNGSHIFHTDDREVWELVTNQCPFWRYEHSVKTFSRLGAFTWPLQYEELARAYGAQVADSLAGDPDTVASNKHPSFEEWCLTIMPRVIYDDFIANYTEKQWGRAGAELDSSFAPKRVQVRRDGDTRLFQDAYQGFPDARNSGSYDLLHRGLWGATLTRRRIVTGTFVDEHWLQRELVQCGRRPSAVFITVPLDEFSNEALGRLDWRGLTFTADWQPVGSAQETLQTHMVYNYPQKTVPFIRTHETKVASRQDVHATVIVTEHPGGPGRFYPVPGKDGTMRARNIDYQDYVVRQFQPYTEIRFAGRLATYRYLDMDDVIREALDLAREMA